MIIYAKTKGISESDAEAFFDSMEAGGWTRAGKALKDWQAALRTWKANGWLASRKNGTRQTFSKPKERAPVYPKMTEKREPTEAEIANARRIAHEETARFKEQFK